jgi:aldose 1-epimerase
MASSEAVFQFLSLGAIIQTFLVGKTNIVQNFPKQSLYKSHNDPYFGETIGRVANRIKAGKIDSLNGKSYSLAVNNEPSHLHGGVVGWGKRIWDGPKPIGVKSIPALPGGQFEGGESVMFKLTSEDGDEGYPGTVEATVTYTAGTQRTGNGKEVRVLGIEYQAELVGGAEETVINMTNHS